ncbi:metallophosphoesterase family protein [Henriciella aquimarina]|uniref:metallophosphoesterase family protein n=1 Tax=Henriciella aquimarina TaxID=545261 RepID=UPI000A01F658|nr:DNA repair exonuclease [Henriciella aquimarina]
MFRFVHTADVHLDSPLKSLALRDPDLAEMVGVATRTAFRRAVDLCINEQVDAFIVAGDLYDGSLRSMKTASYFGEEMRRLTEAGIHAFIIRGNHDAESIITRELTLPEGVHVFSKADKPVILKDGAVAVHGVSFEEPHAPNSLLSRYQPGTPGVIDIGAMHTSLDGSPNHDVYAPCSTADLAAHGYTYWALGHIHKRKVTIHDDCTIVMPGIPQGRHMNEDGVKSISLTTIAETGKCTVEERYVAPVRFERQSLDVSQIGDWRELLELSNDAFNKLRSGPAADQEVIVRLTCIGDGGFARKMRHDRERLEEELRSAASRVGHVHLEQVTFDVAASQAVKDNRVSELSAIVQGGQIDRDQIALRLEDDVQQLIQKLPGELRSRFDPAENKGIVQDLSEEGVLDLLAQIEGDG